VSHHSQSISLLLNLLFSDIISLCNAPLLFYSWINLCNNFHLSPSPPPLSFHHNHFNVFIVDLFIFAYVFAEHVMFSVHFNFHK
jgi:hypothetical protein